MGDIGIGLVDFVSNEIFHIELDVEHAIPEIRLVGAYPIIVTADHSDTCNPTQRSLTSRSDDVSVGRSRDRFAIQDETLQAQEGFFHLAPKLLEHGIRNGDARLEISDIVDR